MTIVTRENIRIPVLVPSNKAGANGKVFRTRTGTLVWNTEHRSLKLMHPKNSNMILLQLSGRNGSLEDHEVRLLDFRAQNRVEGLEAEVQGALNALRTQGVIANRFRESDRSATSTIVEMNPDLGAGAQAACDRKASVTLFKESGTYSTVAPWRVPVNAIGPGDMRMSPDFQCLPGGSVLVDAMAAEEFPETRNWGFPYLITAEES